MKRTREKAVTVCEEPRVTFLDLPSEMHNLILDASDRVTPSNVAVTCRAMAYMVRKRGKRRDTRVHVIEEAMIRDTSLATSMDMQWLQSAMTPAIPGIENTMFHVIQTLASINAVSILNALKPIVQSKYQSIDVTVAILGGAARGGQSQLFFDTIPNASHHTSHNRQWRIYNTLSNAAGHGHVELLRAARKWMKSDGRDISPWDPSKALQWAQSAAEHGQLPVMKWLYTHGIPHKHARDDKDDIFKRACESGHLPLVQYLDEVYACSPTHQSFCIVAAKGGSVPVIHYLRTANPPHRTGIYTWTRAAVGMAAIHGHGHVLTYMYGPTGSLCRKKTAHLQPSLFNLVVGFQSHRDTTLRTLVALDIPPPIDDDTAFRQIVSNVTDPLPLVHYFLAHGAQWTSSVCAIIVSRSKTGLECALNLLACVPDDIVRVHGHAMLQRAILYRVPMPMIDAILDRGVSWTYEAFKNLLEHRTQGGDSNTWCDEDRLALIARIPTSTLIEVERGEGSTLCDIVIGSQFVAAYNALYARGLRPSIHGMRMAIELNDLEMVERLARSETYTDSDVDWIVDTITGKAPRLCQHNRVTMTLRADIITRLCELRVITLDTLIVRTLRQSSLLPDAIIDMVAARATQ